MFWREHARYIVSILIAIALAVFVFVLIFKSIGGNPNATPANDNVDMTQYIDTNAVMEFTAQGPIVADQDFRAVKIKVDNNYVSANVLKGYNYKTIDSKSFPNNQQAFEVFVRALSIMGYDNGDANPKLANEKGYCPTGVRYIFAITRGGETEQRYWRGSCGVGSFKGTYQPIVNLFKNQVPDFGQFTGSVGFGF